jgi:hypothetical protein
MPNPIMPSSHKLAGAIAGAVNTNTAVTQSYYDFVPLAGQVGPPSLPNYLGPNVTVYGSTPVPGTGVPLLSAPQYRIEGGGTQLRCRGSIITTGSIAEGATLFTLPYAPNETGLFTAFSLYGGTYSVIPLLVCGPPYYPNESPPPPTPGAVILYTGSLVVDTAIWLDPITIGILT